MRLWVTRAEPDAARQAESLVARGHEPVVEPLLAIAFDDRVPLPLEGAQALIATSRNGLRALARRPECAAALKLPLFVVGPGSAELARRLGFAEVHQGPGTGGGLVEEVAATCLPERGPLVHLAGAVLASDLRGGLEARGYTVLQPALYRAEPAAELGAGLRRALADKTVDGVILMSPRTAKVYMRVVRDGGLMEAARQLHHFCLSEAVATCLSALDSRNVRVAARPQEEDLLALLDEGTANGNVSAGAC